MLHIGSVYCPSPSFVLLACTAADPQSLLKKLSMNFTVSQVSLFTSLLATVWSLITTIFLERSIVMGLMMIHYNSQH